MSPFYTTHSKRRRAKFIKALQKLNSNTTRFGSNFLGTLNEIEKVTKLQLIIKDLCLLNETKDPKYVQLFMNVNGRQVLSSLDIHIPEDMHSFFIDSLENEKTIQGIFEKITLFMESLPSEEKPLLATRLRNESRERAKKYCCKLCLSK